MTQAVQIRLAAFAFFIFFNNIQDGWEPLCKFLGKPIPEGPVPKENIGGTDYVKNRYR